MFSFLILTSFVSVLADNDSQEYSHVSSKQYMQIRQSRTSQAAGFSGMPQNDNNSDAESDASQSQRSGPSHDGNTKASDFINDISVLDEKAGREPYSRFRFIAFKHFGKCRLFDRALSLSNETSIPEKKRVGKFQIDCGLGGYFNTSGDISCTLSREDVYNRFRDILYALIPPLHPWYSKTAEYSPR